VPPQKKSVSRPGRALTALGVLIIVMLLGIVGKDLATPSNWKHDFKVQLGLDLAGGTSVTLRAQTNNGKPITSAVMNEARSIMIARVNGAGFSGAQVQQQGSTDMVITVPGQNAQKVVNLVGKTAQLFFRQVLLVGGPTSTATPSSTSTTTPSTPPTVSPSTTPSSGSTPSNSASSTSSPKAAGAPGATGQTGARGLTASSRLLSAAKPQSAKTTKPKASSTPSTSTSPSPTPSSTTPATTPASQVSGNASLVSPAVLKEFNKLDCSKKNWKQQINYVTSVYDNANTQIVTCSFNSTATGYSSGTKVVLDKAKVYGNEVTGAQAGTANSQTSVSSQWQVNLSLNGAGTAAFGTLTAQMNSQYGNNGSPTSPLDQLAVVLDGQIVSAPNIDQGAIPGGQAQISPFTQSQADTLAQELNYGSLPITLSQQNVNSVSPQLGRNYLDAGLIAAGIGLGLVVVYSFLYYRGLGIVSVSSLIVAAILAFGAVVLLSRYSGSGFSLSLAGIAGLIVAIGITADSFVVFFERLRDEVREGKSLRPAVESGWKRARRTILVSDTVSFLAALLLWYFSISDVKGFAFTLGLTTLIDIIVVFLFTKPMVTILAKTKFFSSGHRMSGLDPGRLGARTPWRSGAPRPSARRVKEA
jgi:preprotein translocase subunit SecD